MAATSIKELGNGPGRKPGNGDSAIFQGLTQAFHSRLGKLRQLIQKQHPIVGQRDLSRAWRRSPANQTGGRNGMMRRPERPDRQQRQPLRQRSGNGMDPGALHRFLKGEGRQDGGQTLGKHTFTGARGPDEQQIMSPGSGNLQSPFGVLLSPDISQVRHGWLGGSGKGHLRSFFQRAFSLEESDDLLYPLDRVHREVRHSAALGGVLVGDENPLETLPAGFQHHGQHPIDRPKLAVQGKLPDKGASLQRKGASPRGGQNPQQDGRS